MNLASAHRPRPGFQRDQGLILQRVPEERITDTGAWEGWGFTPADGWGWGRPLTVALAGQFGELSLRRVEGRWMLAFFDQEHYAMDVMAIDSPTADLYRAPRATVRGCSWEDEDHAAGRVAQLTAATSCPAAHSQTCTWW